MDVSSKLSSACYWAPNRYDTWNVIIFCKLLRLVLKTSAMTVKVKCSVLIFSMPKAHEQPQKEQGKIQPNLRVDQFNKFPYPHYSQAETCPSLILLKYKNGKGHLPKL